MGCLAIETPRGSSCLGSQSLSSLKTLLSESSLWALQASSTVNTPSYTPYSPLSRTDVPWTGLSLTLAVSWMLLLAFGYPSTSSSEILAPQTTRIHKVLEMSLLTSLRIVAHQATSLKKRGYTEALAQAPASDR